MGTLARCSARGLLSAAGLLALRCTCTDPSLSAEKSGARSAALAEGAASSSLNWRTQLAAVGSSKGSSAEGPFIAFSSSGVCLGASACNTTLQSESSQSFGTRYTRLLCMQSNNSLA